jgi:hypothetical protein
MPLSRGFEGLERLSQHVRDELAALAPTAAQLAYLRAMATKHGTTYAEPVTRQQASAQVKRLKHARRRQPGTLEPVTRTRPGLAPSSWRPWDPPHA